MVTGPEFARMAKAAEQDAIDALLRLAYGAAAAARAGTDVPEEALIYPVAFAGV